MKKTAENDFNKAVECIVKSDFYNDLNKCLDMVKLLDKNKELQERIEDLNIINEEHKILNGMIRKELQQKENIIKEVREDLYQVVKWCTENKHNEDTIERYLVVDYGTTVRKINEIRTKLDKEVN